MPALESVPDNRPLVSVPVELRLVGRSQIYAGVPFWFIGVLVEPWPRALIIAPVVGLLTAIGLHRFSYMRSANEGIRSARRPKIHALESPLAARGRAALLILLITPLVLLGAASDQMAVVGALISGNGLAVFFAGRRLHRWELETGKFLLREPRRRRGKDKASEPHGFFDSRDFYVATSEDA
jgi:hypothetical protein